MIFRLDGVLCPFALSFFPSSPLLIPCACVCARRREKRRIRFNSFALPHRRSSFIRVVLGAHSIATREPSQQIFSIQESVAHPDYNAAAVRNDIRLLKVSWGEALVVANEGLDYKCGRRSWE